MMNSTLQKTVFVIGGPTAVGKTRVAIDLAKFLNTSIISADSRQCYREMNIGTACPSEEELAEVKHYFIREFPITENITAADFEVLALNYLDTIFKHSDFAVVCGGTGLYLKALTEGLDEMPSIDLEIDKNINQEYNEKGILWLQNLVKNEDPEFFLEGETQNPARLLRALVFKLSTKKSIIHFRTGIKKERNFRVIKIALDLPRNILYERINQRVDAMLGNGLLEEVKSLFPYKNFKNLQTVGYAELFDFLDGKCSLDFSIEKIKQHSRNYAKRQITWFKKDKAFVWLQNDELGLEGIKNLL